MGYLSQLADSFARIAFVCSLSISAFIAGAACGTLLINWAREAAPRHQYAWPLAVQGGLLVCFACGGLFASEVGPLFALACLCFIMRSGVACAFSHNRRCAPLRTAWQPSWQI